MKYVLVCLTALTLVMTSGVVASAKSLSQIARETGLSPQDFDLLKATGRTLYDTKNPQPGKIVSWTNPDSGSHGTVRLAAMRGNCAFIQHFVHPKGNPTAIELRTQWCRGDDGRWLLQP